MKKTALILIALLMAALVIGCGNQVIRSAEIYMQQNDLIKAREVINQGLPTLQPGKTRAEAYYFLAKMSNDEITTINARAKRDSADVAKQKEHFDSRLRTINQFNIEADSSMKNDNSFKGRIDTLRTNLWIEYFNAGVAPFNDHKWSNAIQAFRLAWYVDSTKNDPARLIGEALLQMERGEEAVGWFTRAIKMEGSTPDFVSRMDIANFYYSKEKWEDAIGYFNQVIAIQASDKDDQQRQKMIKTVQSQAVANKAICLDQLNRTEEATRAYETALKAQPDNAVLWFNYGKRQFEVGVDDKTAKDEKTKRLLDAEKSFKEVIRIDANDADAMYLLGLTTFALEQYEDAEKWLRQSLKIKPDNKAAWMNLTGAVGNQIVALGDKGNEAKRKELLRKLEELTAEKKKLGIE
ncbi:MAG: tetratricopeptide repeat protein [bacterium]|nr:tetratricopeptide repeat protein [bacterium]